MSAALPPAFVVSADPAGAAARVLPDSVDRLVAVVPDEPYDLTPHHLVLALTVRTRDDATRTLVAATRGVALVLVVALGGPDRAAFLDELRRVADVRDPREAALPPGAELSDKQRRLLALLGAGRSVAAAAREVGLSERSAHRRLREARDALGAASSVEAILLAAGARLAHFGDADEAHPPG